MPTRPLRGAAVVVALATALATGVGCGGSTTRSQADAPTTLPATSTTIDEEALCQKLNAERYRAAFAALDDQRAQLEETEHDLNQKLTAAIASGSPDAEN